MIRKTVMSVTRRKASVSMKRSSTPGERCIVTDSVRADDEAGHRIRRVERSRCGCADRRRRELILTPVTSKAERPVCLRDPATGTVEVDALDPSMETWKENVLPCAGNWCKLDVNV